MLEYCHPRTTWPLTWPFRTQFQQYHHTSEPLHYLIADWSCELLTIDETLTIYTEENYRRLTYLPRADTQEEMREISKQLGIVAKPVITREDVLDLVRLVSDYFDEPLPLSTIQLQSYSDETRYVVTRKRLDLDFLKTFMTRVTDSTGVSSVDAINGVLYFRTY